MSECGEVAEAREVAPSEVDYSRVESLIDCYRLGGQPREEPQSSSDDSSDDWVPEPEVAKVEKHDYRAEVPWDLLIKDQKQAYRLAHQKRPRPVDLRYIKTNDPIVQYRVVDLGNRVELTPMPVLIQGFDLVPDSVLLSNPFIRGILENKPYHPDFLMMDHPICKEIFQFCDETISYHSVERLKEGNDSDAIRLLELVDRELSTRPLEHWDKQLALDTFHEYCIDHPRILVHELDDSHEKELEAEQEQLRKDSFKNAPPGAELLPDLKMPRRPGDEVQPEDLYLVLMSKEQREALRTYMREKNSPYPPMTYLTELYYNCQDKEPDRCYLAEGSVIQEYINRGFWGSGTSYDEFRRTLAERKWAREKAEAETAAAARAAEAAALAAMPVKPKRDDEDEDEMDEDDKGKGKGKGEGEGEEGDSQTSKVEEVKRTASEEELLRAEAVERELEEIAAWSIENNVKMEDLFVMHTGEKIMKLPKGGADEVKMKLSMPAWLGYSSDESGDDSSRAPSMYRLREDPPPNRLERQFSVRLFETETIHLFRAEPLTVDPASEEYTNMLPLKENRAPADKSMRTLTPPDKIKFTWIEPRVRANGWSQVSPGLFAQDLEAEARGPEPQPNLWTTDIPPSDEESSSEDEDWYLDSSIQVVESPRFWEACQLMERLLASNLYYVPQHLFDGNAVMDPSDTKMELRYKFKFLWVMKEDPVKGLAVVALDWNPASPDVLAAGYGRFLLEQPNEGYVLIWNVKNPRFPERQYLIQGAVTCLKFSRQHPNMLLVGTYLGTLCILDIANPKKVNVAYNGLFTVFNGEPVWQVSWFQRGDEEEGWACGQNGKVYSLRKDAKLSVSRMTAVCFVRGPLKGVTSIVYPDQEPLARRRPAAVSMAQHPSKPNLYLVASELGILFVCDSTNLKDYSAFFRAHSGPIYNIQFHPHSDKIFLTCGADFAVRIWGWGFWDKPLHELFHRHILHPCDCAVWSKLHPTHIISVVSDKICLWDITRTGSDPIRVIGSASGERLTTCQWTGDGQCIAVGDVKGKLFVYTLSRLPRPPTYPELLLAKTIRKIVGPDLIRLKGLEKLGPPFFNPRKDLQELMFPDEDGKRLLEGKPRFQPMCTPETCTSSAPPP